MILCVIYKYKNTMYVSRCHIILGYLQYSQKYTRLWGLVQHFGRRRESFWPSLVQKLKTYTYIVLPVHNLTAKSYLIILYSKLQNVKPILLQT